MLNNLRNFAKTKLAVVLVGIIIIPFVFWGMGGVFSGGNKNNIAKINDKSISTQDFVNYVNLSKIESDTIRKNIDNNIIEEILAELISKTMISMEINDLNLKISDKILKKTIKENNNFKDENNNFSRIKYEKFLLSSNLSAPDFESRLRENELRKELFSYVSGGLNSPLFLVNNTYKEQSKKVLNKQKVSSKNFTKQIAFNVIPHIDTFMEDRYTKEEWKMTVETKKILDPSISLSATCVRVPVFVGHSESVNVEFNSEVNAKKIRECLEKAPGCKVVDETKDGGYITPVESSGDFLTYISRIRDDHTQKNSINMCVVSDNLLKGAALNAVQIANVLIKKYIN